MSKSKGHKHHKKQHGMLSYITHAAIYVLLSLIVILPAAFFGFNYAQDLVHKAQKSYSMSAADAVVDASSFEPSGVKSGKVKRKALYNCQKVGELSCVERGFECDVFKGYNRASIRYGAGLYTKFGMPGDNTKIYIGSYSTRGFKAIDNLKVGDTVKFVTGWGEYEYKVNKTVVATKHEADENKETLILTAQPDKNAFSAYNQKQLYVYAEKVSGPEVEEVEQ